MEESEYLDKISQTKRELFNLLLFLVLFPVMVTTLSLFFLR